MRVNMDSSMISDPRFELVADQLGLDVDAVFGKCFRLWLAAYERRSKCFRKREADIAARCKGFADALIEWELADSADGDRIELHGVEARIRFLEAQAKKGRKGGKSSGKARKAPPEANAEATAEANAEANGSGSAQAYTLTPAPDLAPEKDVAPPSEAGLRLAEYLRKKILEVKPDHRLRLKRHWTKATRTSWAKTCDDILRKDERDPHRTKAVVDWVFGDQGGRDARFVVESPKALRTKWDRIDAAMSPRQPRLVDDAPPPPPSARGSHARG